MVGALLTKDERTRKEIPANVEALKLMRLRLREIVYQTCSGVWAMHSNNILHRDLKADNILMSDKMQNLVPRKAVGAEGNRDPNAKYGDAGYDPWDHTRLLPNNVVKIADFGTAVRHPDSLLLDAQERLHLKKAKRDERRNEMNRKRSGGANKDPTLEEDLQTSAKLDVGQGKSSPVPGKKPFTVMWYKEDFFQGIKQTHSGKVRGLGSDNWGYAQLGDFRGQNKFNLQLLKLQEEDDPSSLKKREESGEEMLLIDTDIRDEYGTTELVGTIPYMSHEIKSWDTDCMDELLKPEKDPTDVPDSERLRAPGFESVDPMDPEGKVRRFDHWGSYEGVQHVKVKGVRPSFRSYSTKSDIWAIGQVAHAIVTGSWFDPRLKTGREKIGGTHAPDPAQWPDDAIIPQEADDMNRGIPPIPLEKQDFEPWALLRKKCKDPVVTDLIMWMLAISPRDRPSMWTCMKTIKDAGMLPSKESLDAFYGRER